MIQYKENKRLAEQIAVQCAPLLAGLKPSNLLIVPKGIEQELKKLLQKTKFKRYLLTEYDDRQVYLLFKTNELVVYLTQKSVQDLLRELGYEGVELFSMLQYISAKYTAHKTKKEPFPHELGLLLGYPAVDVKGFMENAGKNFLYSGYWKVYGNARETIRLFAEFEHAKDDIVYMVKKGCSIVDITAMYHKAKAYA